MRPVIRIFVIFFSESEHPFWINKLAVYGHQRNCENLSGYQLYIDTDDITKAVEKDKNAMRFPEPWNIETAWIPINEGKSIMEQINRIQKMTVREVRRIQAEYIDAIQNGQEI